jgi:hypothetical protein
VFVSTGNSLGGASNKKIIRDKLGSRAELSDGEGSDDECKFTTIQTINHITKLCLEHCLV